MKRKIAFQKLILAFVLVMAGVVATACNRNGDGYSEDEMSPSTGRIFMYGVIHGNATSLERQLELWGEHYHNDGMRHLFIETSYATAQLLNLWMTTDDGNDVILNQLFDDWHGTVFHNHAVLDFYRAVKREFPETVFHGSDVGQQDATTSQRFLQHLTDSGQQGSAEYGLTRENIAQFQRFEDEGSHSVRAYYKPLNFIRQFDALRDQDVMAIHGWVHVELGDFLTYWGLPTMTQVLYDRYGDNLYIVDLRDYALQREPLWVETMDIVGFELEAGFYGMDDTAFNDIVMREFWRLEEGAYELFADAVVTGNVLNFDEFPMTVRIGQVVVLDVHFYDGHVSRHYYRSSGAYWNGRPAMQEFVP
ncbi:MAG: hypothetical protein FWD97_07985 [Defluviitaleaceae bacterium]|nr:hypothetical protein [Defluviitaleaceae bacterium]